jgi:hypothetical protein
LREILVFIDCGGGIVISCLINQFTTNIYLYEGYMNVKMSLGNKLISLATAATFYGCPIDVPKEPKADELVLDIPSRLVKDREMELYIRPAWMDGTTMDTWNYTAMGSGPLHQVFGYHTLSDLLRDVKEVIIKRRIDRLRLHEDNLVKLEKDKIIEVLGNQSVEHVEGQLDQFYTRWAVQRLTIALSKE